MKPRRFLFSGPLLTCLALLTACSTTPQAPTASPPSAVSPSTARPELAVTGAYVRQPPLDDMAAGYFVITNSGQAADRLLGVSSDFATDITMHRTTTTGAMEPVPSFSIPARGRLVLSVGGNHLMLMGMRSKPVVGDTVVFRLRFADSAPITVRAPVEPTSYQPSS